MIGTKATVIVSGIPGVGKTTVFRELEAQAKAKMVEAHSFSVFGPHWVIGENHGE